MQQITTIGTGLNSESRKLLKGQMFATTGFSGQGCHLNRMKVFPFNKNWNCSCRPTHSITPLCPSLTA